jgi:hypothetical protein
MYFDNRKPFSIRSKTMYYDTFYTVRPTSALRVQELDAEAAWLEDEINSAISEAEERGLSNEDLANNAHLGVLQARARILIREINDLIDLAEGA